MSNIFRSKFITILKTFSNEDWKAFELWLKSPWCNSNKNLIKLLENLKKYYPQFEDEGLTKQKLFKQVLPKGKYSTRRMNNLLSEGYLTAQKFLTFQNFSQNQNLQQDVLSQELQNRHLNDWFFGIAETEINRLESKKVKDWEDHLDLLRLHRRVYHHPNQSPRMQPGGLTIVKMGEQLNLVFLLEKAAIINEKIFRSKILKNENHDVKTELEQWHTLSQGIHHLSIDFYRRRFAYTKENKLEEYSKLRTDFLERFEELNEKEQKIHLISLLNDAARLAKAKRIELVDLLPIYQLGLKTGILLTENKLTINTYSTVVITSNLKKSFDFTSQFIDTYTQKLDVQFQEDARNWATAHLAYRKKEWTVCLDTLIAHEFSATYFQLLSKMLTTQVYFDLYLQDDSYERFLFNYFDAFEKWLSRSKVKAKSNYKAYLRFVQICRLLAKSIDDVNFKAEKITHLLDNETYVQAPSWLKQKVNEVLQLKNT